jgi:hypothetical protein
MSPDATRKDSLMTTREKIALNGKASVQEVTNLMSDMESTMIIDGVAKEIDEAPPTEGTGQEVPYEDFVDILASGKYSGELWAELERDKIRAQVEVRFASTRNNEQRLTAATEKLNRLVSEQNALEEEFPSAKMWGKFFISSEAVTAKQAENNTPR